MVVIVYYIIEADGASLSQILMRWVSDSEHSEDTRLNGVVGVVLYCIVFSART